MTKKSIKKAGKGKQRSKSVKAKIRVNDGKKDIARAEQRLERTLHKLDNVRAELAEREAALRDLLVMHGRMPVEEPAGATPILDQHQVTHPLDGLSDGGGVDGAGSVSVPLLDQRQILNSDPGEPTEHER